MPLHPQFPPVPALHIINHRLDSSNRRIRHRLKPPTDETHRLRLRIPTFSSSRTNTTATALINVSRRINQPVVGNTIPPPGIHVVTFKRPNRIGTRRTIPDTTMMNNNPLNPLRNQWPKTMRRRTRTPLHPVNKLHRNLNSTSIKSRIFSSKALSSLSNWLRVSRGSTTRT